METDRIKERLMSRISKMTMSAMTRMSKDHEELFEKERWECLANRMDWMSNVPEWVWDEEWGLYSDKKGRDQTLIFASTVEGDDFEVMNLILSCWMGGMDWETFGFVDLDSIQWTFKLRENDFHGMPKWIPEGVQTYLQIQCTDWAS